MNNLMLSTTPISSSQSHLLRLLLTDPLSSQIVVLGGRVTPFILVVLGGDLGKDLGVLAGVGAGGGGGLRRGVGC